MKKMLLFLTIIGSILTSSNAQPGLNIAQQHRVYVNSLLATVGINKQTITTGILYDRSPTIANLQGFHQSDVVGKGKFMQAALELRNSAYDTLTHQTIDQLRGIAEHYTYRRNQAPIALNYNTLTYIDTLAVEKGYIVIDGQGRPRPTGRLKTYGLIDREIFMAAALWDKSELNSLTEFVIPSELIMGNKRAALTQIEVDFGDGQGFRSVTPDVPVSVSYQTAGEKTITIRATTEDETTISSTSSITIRSNDPFEWGAYGYIDEDTYRRIHIYADIPFSGSNGNFKGLGWLTILLNDTAQGLQKPVLIVDGFDPGNNNKDEHIFSKYLNADFKFANELHALGYDLVILDFPKAANENILEQVCVEWDEDEFGYYCSHWGWQPKVIDAGADYIQRNAFTAVTVIETLNQQLQQNGSNEELVVVGPSMGGLITRYALRYMELEPDLNTTPACGSPSTHPTRGPTYPLAYSSSSTTLIL
jgi:hypothetical protein